MKIHPCVFIRCFCTPWPSLKFFSISAPIPVCFLLTTLPRVVFKYYTVFEIKDTAISVSYTSSNTPLLQVETPHTTQTKTVLPFMVASHFWFTVTCDERVPPGSSLHTLFQNTVSLLFLASKWIISSFFLLTLNSFPLRQPSHWGSYFFLTWASSVLILLKFKPSQTFLSLFVICLTF